MSAIDKVKETKEQIKNKKINLPKWAKYGLAGVSGVAVVGGAIYLISKHVNVEKATEVVVEAAPEVAKTVEQAAEAVL